MNSSTSTAPSTTDSPALLGETPGKIVTMKDIAKVAGVTSMTVSRVMNGDKDVSPKTRSLVLRIAQELNYTTNAAGRALRTGRSGTIGVISGSIEHPYNATIVTALEAVITRNGYQSRLVLSQGDLKNLVTSTQPAFVDGIIIAGLHGLLDQFQSVGYRITQPHVHICIVKLEGEDCVQCDLVPAVEEALQAMLAAGRKRIAYVGVGEGDAEGNFPLDDPEIRTQTYVAMMARAGRTPELISATPSYHVGRHARIEILRSYFQNHGCPDGILCVNDDIAMQTYRALMDVGCRIPHDTLLVGCDGLSSMAYFEPPLSTIAQPIEAMCAQAWQFLQARIENPKLAPQYARFQAELVKRGSLQV